MMRTEYTVSADHPAPAYDLHMQVVTVKRSDDGTYSAQRKGFGYTCGHVSPYGAIRDLLQSNGCERIRIEGEPSQD